MLAGDLNAPPAHPAFARLRDQGWEGADPAPGMGIDRVLHRGMEVVSPARRLPAAERDIAVSWRGLTRRIRLSDHDPVVVTLRVRESA